jgi:hypothetical protein
MALAKLQTNSKPEFATIIDSLQLGGDGKTVSLAFALPSEIIDMLGTFARPRSPDRDRNDPDDDPSDAPPQPPVPPAPPAPPQPKL